MERRMSLDLRQDDNVIDRITHGFKPSPEQTSKITELHNDRNEIISNQTKTYLENLFKSNSTRSIQVEKIQIEGTQNFRDSFLIRQISPFIDSSTTVSKLLQNVDLITLNFLKTNTISDISIQLNTINTSNDIIKVIPKLKLSPINRFTAKTGTSIGNGEGDGYMSFQLRNIFGGGENLTLDASTGTTTRSSYLINFATPLFNEPDWRFETSGFINNRKIDWSSHEQVIKGFNGKISSVNLGKGINHEFSVENVLRSITNVSNHASNNVISQAGDDFKSSFIYNFKFDSRDNKTLPKSGGFLQINNEIANLNKFSTSNFIKQSLESLIATSLFDENIVINASLKSGWLYSLNGNKTTHLMDRFYLGGPNDVRSFYYNGLGPRNHNDCLGGDVFLSGGLSIFSKIPFVSKNSAFKIHSFVNFGRLIALDHNDNSIGSTIKTLISEPSTSTGIGLVFNHPQARFELNFVLPITVHQSDSIRKGFQYGIGINFL